MTRGSDRAPTGNGSHEPPGRYCSLQGSWTDTLTNVSVVAPGHAHELRSIVELGRAPDAIGLEFLHESAHQWCLNSPVGAALALLETRVNVAAASADAGETISFLEFSDDLIRLEVARELLRPLIEGIAVFAEFDARTGERTQSLSLPLRQMATLYTSRSSFDGIGDVSTGGVTGMLRDLRLTRTALARRVNVLSRPLASKSRGRLTGGYLLGYLSVKSLWLNWVAQDDGALVGRESDLFLSFLRAYVFRDFGLVGVLLDEDWDGIESIQAIQRYIERRLAQFRTLGMSCKELLEFDEFVAVGERSFDQGTTRERMEKFLRCDLDMYTQGIFMWEHLAGYLRAEGSQGRLVTNLLNGRHYMHLARLECDFEITMPGSALAYTSDRDESLEFAVHPSLCEGGAAQLDVFFPTRRPDARIVALSQDGHILALVTYWGGEEPDEMLAQQLAEFDEVARAREQIQSIAPLIDLLLEAHDRLDTFRYLRETILPEITVSLFMPHSLLGCTWELDDALLEELAEDGLFCLSGLDRDTLEGIAVVGLGTGSGLRTTELDTQLAAFGLPPLIELLTWIEARSQVDGCPTGLQVEDRLLLSL